MSAVFFMAVFKPLDKSDLIDTILVDCLLLAWNNLAPQYIHFFFRNKINCVLSHKPGMKVNVVFLIHLPIGSEISLPEINF